MTKTGMLVGTIDYIAPEQIQGAQLDARADIYSLGCVLYEALTGACPTRATPSGEDVRPRGEPPPSVLQSSRGPGRLEDVVARAMAKDPADRYPSAGDLGRAALAVAEARSTTPQERSVATGDAAVAQGQATPAPAAPPAGYTHPAPEYTPQPPQYSPPQPAPFSPAPSPPVAQPVSRRPAAGASGWPVPRQLGRAWRSHADRLGRGGDLVHRDRRPRDGGSDDVFAIVWIFVGAPLAVFVWSVLPTALSRHGQDAPEEHGQGGSHEDPDDREDVVRRCRRGGGDHDGQDRHRDPVDQHGSATRAPAGVGTGQPLAPVAGRRTDRLGHGRRGGRRKRRGLRRRVLRRRGCVLGRRVGVLSRRRRGGGRSLALGDGSVAGRHAALLRGRRAGFGYRERSPSQITGRRVAIGGILRHGSRRPLLEAGRDLGSFLQDRGGRLAHVGPQLRHLGLGG